MVNAEALQCLLFREHRHQPVKVGEEHEAAVRVRRLRGFLRNNVLQGTPHSSRAVTLCMEFIAARVTAPICAVASREGPIFCVPM
jgi:hypothetical protein